MNKWIATLLAATFLAAFLPGQRPEQPRRPDRANEPARERVETRRERAERTAPRRERAERAAPQRERTERAEPRRPRAEQRPGERRARILRALRDRQERGRGLEQRRPRRPDAGPGFEGRPNRLFLRRLMMRRAALRALRHHAPERFDLRRQRPEAGRALQMRRELLQKAPRQRAAEPRGGDARRPVRGERRSRV